MVIQPDQEVVRTARIAGCVTPSCTSFWLEMIGVGISTGNVLSAALCALVPLIGIRARITGEERELVASLPGYGSTVGLAGG